MASVSPIGAARERHVPEPVDAQDAFVLRHQTRAWRFARLLGCSSDLAEDLVQEALLAALHKGIDRRDDAVAERWLREAVRNLWRMQLRTWRRRPVHVDLDAAEAALERHAASSSAAAANARDGGDSFIVALRDCVAALSGRARRVIELRYRANLSREAIASALAMTEDGIKTLLRRTRERLFDCVQRRRRSDGDSA